ncbi:MAG: type II secretion system protein [Oceanisphaera sp.]|uniref:type II secretion system protein n=1 Tax=Oceanisphaera sp. TaxID=1929979 RepID=UPI003C77C138
MRQSGFTLIELLVVLTLIGLIAGTVGPNFFEAAKRMGNKNDKQSIRQQVNGLPLAALHQGMGLQINEQGAPFDLPEGWQLTAKQPITYQPNGVCLGGTVILAKGKDKQQQQLTAPFCQWPANNG